MKIKNLIIILVILFMGSIGLANKANAQSATTTIQQLFEQIKVLQQQILELQAKQKEVQSQIKENVQMARQLSLGMSGEDVRALQELLASDPEVYPEGLITGFFGPLTEKAVKKFQEKNKIESVGRVGPKTLSQINILLTQGAGKSGKVPPGLLKAPGIAKKFPDGLPGKATTTPDTIAPVISNLKATSTSSTVSISWNTNEPTIGKVWLGTTTPVTTSNSTAKSSATKTTSHSFSFGNLATSTLHYYLVNSSDAAGNSSTSTQASISTLE